MRIALDDPRIADSGLEVVEGEGVAIITLPPQRPGDTPQTVRVAVIDDELHFFPQRSSAQKRVLAMLGMAVE